MMLPEQTCRRFTLAEIKLATENFHETLVIGKGGFGKVYRCHSKKIGLVTEIAIKRLDSKSSQGASEFEAEVQVLSKLRHGNLVSLIGYCNEGEEMILAYEFMPNGTLEDHLHKDDHTDLSLLQRLKICIGAARGLDYLHTGTATQQGVIHRDVKTSNILLDANFAAKIADFGLAKVGPINQTRTFVSTGVKGTFGYMDPCYFYSGKLTRKSDVYAFGVVLFEVLCGKKAVDPTLDKEQWSLAVWAQDQIKEGKLSQLIDSRLMGQISKKCLKEFVSIAGQCLHNQPKNRPTMMEVVFKLESIMSQERKYADSSAGEGGLMDKVRFFLTGKPNMMAAPAVGSQPEISSSNIRISNPFPEKAIKTFNNRCLKVFTYEELENATNNFQHEEYSTSLQDTIYKGWVDEETYAPAQSDGLAMYVRKGYQENPWQIHAKIEEFIHPNLVKPLGYCKHHSYSDDYLYTFQKTDDYLYLVYELLPDASLVKLLFREIGTSPLSWVARLKITIGAAQGLSFLHRREQASYRQFRTAVILVDNDFNARLSNYELGRVNLLEESNCFTDKFYALPELLSARLGVQQLERQCATYVYSGIVGSELQYEIYAFGVVMLEILTGKNVCVEKNLVEWATPLLTNEANLGMIIDPQLGYRKNPPKGAFKFALLVSKCLRADPKCLRANPKGVFKFNECLSMEEIVQVLYECYKIYTGAEYSVSL